jgi:hypothetical protein
VESEKEGINVAGVRKADETGEAVMVDGQAKKFGGNGVRLNVVERIGQRLGNRSWLLSDI